MIFIGGRVLTLMVWKLIFTVQIHKCQNSSPYKYHPLQVFSSSLLMKTSCLRLKLVELNFLVSFNTDDQSKTDVANTANVITYKSKSSRWTFSINSLSDFACTQWYLYCTHIDFITWYFNFLHFLTNFWFTNTNSIMRHICQKCLILNNSSLQNIQC